MKCDISELSSWLKLKTETVTASSLKQLLYSCFCGINENDEATAETIGHQETVNEAKITSSEQDPRAKIALHVSLLFVICTGIFLYAFWSVGKFEVR